MTDKAFVYIETCPLDNCVWASDPATRSGVVKEALRAHISGHDHAQLVEHVFMHAANTVVYERNLNIPALRTIAAKEDRS